MSTISNLPVETVSSGFRKQVIRSIIAICSFILVYFILFILSLVLVALCCYLGVGIMTARIGLYTLLGGGGLILFSGLVLLFLIKFIFATSKTDERDSIEITAAEQPELFAVIYQLVDELKTTRPRKVLLSPDVNACVFYHSSFWSMFLPVRKNLKIGLGLVNAVNVSELKAVLAHEFGHFSQKSMKVGSWVYQVNKIIYDMLYDNQGYAGFLVQVAKVHGIFAFFAQLTVSVIKGIQFILQKMYGLVNKSYMGLSREMEFHADLAAAAIFGSNNIINALKRSEFAEVCYAQTMKLCDEYWQEKKVVSNFFQGHALVLQEFARLNQFPLVNDLPLVTDKSSSINNRVNFKNQWASHPTLAERKSYLEPFALEQASEEVSAWFLFQNKEQWQEALTERIYRNVPKEEVVCSLTIAEFNEKLKHQLNHYSFPSVFKEFYDARSVSFFDATAISQEPTIISSFETVFTEETALLPKKIELLNQDMAILKAIVNRELEVQSFDFDGKKYNRKEAAAVLVIAEGETAQLNKDLERADKELFRYFYSLTPFAKAEAYKQEWVLYFELRKESDEYLEKVNKIMNILSPIYRGETIGIETISNILADFKTDGEPNLKKMLRYWMEKNAFTKIGTLEKLNKYLASDYVYFSGKSFFETELIELNEVVRESWDAISEYIFYRFKKLVTLQADFLEKKKELINF